MSSAVEECLKLEREEARERAKKAKRAKRGYYTDRLPPRPLVGPWTDIGEGECQRCSTVRRLYRPHIAPELAYCAPCSVTRYNHSCVAPDYDPKCDREDYEGGDAKAPINEGEAQP